MGFLDRLFRKDAAPDNRALENALRDLAQIDSPARRRAFYDLLKASTLILATPHEAPENRTKVSDGSLEIAFMATTDAQGNPAMLVFTGEPALLAWRPAGCVYTALPARDAFRLALQKELATIVINPRGPAGGYLTRTEFAALAEGLYPGSTTENVASSGFDISPPSPQPADTWLAALRSHAQPVKSIRSLFLVTASINSGPPHYLIGIELAAGARAEDVMPRFLETIRPTIAEGAYVDFVPLEDNSLGAEIRSKGLRIFKFEQSLR